VPDFGPEQGKDEARIGNTGETFDALRAEIRRVPEGYGENRPFRRRETSTQVDCAFGSAP
jgi:hypothetical protein